MTSSYYFLSDQSNLQLFFNPSKLFTLADFTEIARYLWLGPIHRFKRSQEVEIDSNRLNAIDRERKSKCYSVLLTNCEIFNAFEHNDKCRIIHG